MKPATYVPISHQRLSSSGTADVQTFTIPNTCSGILLTVETTAARITLDGSDPSAVNAPSLVIPSAASPVLVPVGPGSTIKHCSTAAAASVLQAAYLQ